MAKTADKLFFFFFFCTNVFFSKGISPPFFLSINLGKPGSRSIEYNAKFVQDGEKFKGILQLLL